MPARLLRPGFLKRTRCSLAAALLILGFGVPGGGLAAQSLPSREAPGAVFLPERAMAHILARHGPDSHAAGAGKFAPGMTAADIRALIAETVHAGTRRADTYGRPDALYDDSFMRPIGTTIQGRPTPRLRVVVAPDGAVITAYPR